MRCSRTQICKAALALSVLLQITACSQPTKVSDAHRWNSGLPLPVNQADFPSNDIASSVIAQSVSPTTVGSVLLRASLIQSVAVRDFVREHGLPSGILITHGKRLELYYLDRDTTFVFVANANGQLALVESAPLSGADRAALDPEKQRERATRELRQYLDQLDRVYRVGRAVRSAVPPVDPTARDIGFLVTAITPASSRLFGIPDGTPGVVVALVHSDGPAVGLLHPGEVINAVNGEPVVNIDGYRPEQVDGLLRLGLATSPARTVVITPSPVPLAFDPILLETDDPNALVTEGGRVVVTSGMLALVDNDDQLATAIGHELGHISEGHLQLTPGKVVSRITLGGLLLPTIVIPIAGPLLAKTIVGVGAHFDRDQERIADQRGIEFAARAGYDPHAAVTLLEAMQRQPSTRDAGSFFDAHPSYPERIENAKQTIEALGASASKVGDER